MADLTPIESLQRFVATELPTARMNVDAPHLPNGSWFVDIEWNGAMAFVEWRPSEGFGVSPEATTYGEGPGLVAKDVAAAAAAAVGFLRSQQGARDALIVTDDASIRTTLREACLDVDITADSVDARYAAARLRERLYRAVIVDIRIEIDGALLAELAASSNRVITIALLPGDTPVEHVSAWAQIAVRHTIDAKDLALVVRTLLHYGDDTPVWPRVSRELLDLSSSR